MTTNTTDYPKLAHSSLFEPVATDLLTFRQKPHPDFPDLPRWTAIVSATDIATQRRRGKVQVPTRNKAGERKQCVYDRLPRGLAERYAKKNGYPFTIHLGNLDDAEQITGLQQDNQDSQD